MLIVCEELYVRLLLNFMKYLKPIRYTIILLLGLVACNQPEPEKSDEIAVATSTPLKDTMSLIDTVAHQDSVKFTLYNPMVDSQRFEFHSNYSSMVHHYLSRYYKTDSVEVLRYYNNDSLKEVCAFKQFFESNIQFYSIMCGESGGRDELVIPKVNQQEIIQLLELLLDIDYEISAWNSDSTLLNTDGAGCFVEIIDQQETWLITITCSC